MVVLGVLVADEMLDRTAAIPGFGSPLIFAVALSEITGFAVPVFFALSTATPVRLSQAADYDRHDCDDHGRVRTMAVPFLLHKPLPAMLGASLCCCC